MKGQCHCGEVQITVPSPPDQVTRCNCSLCRKTGWIGGYWHPEEVAVEAVPDALSAYIQGDRMITTWELLPLRLAHPLDPDHRVTRPDGREYADVRAGRVAASAGTGRGRGEFLDMRRNSSNDPRHTGSLILRDLSIYLLSTICAFAFAPAVHAKTVNETGEQTEASSLTGNYRLGGVMETAAQLQLDADGRYKWMLIVGSLDLYSEGKWKQAGGQVILGPHQFGKDTPVFALAGGYPWGREETEAAFASETIRLQNRAKLHCAFLETGGYYASSEDDAVPDDLTPLQHFEAATKSERELRAAYERAIAAYFARDLTEADDNLEVSARTARRSWGQAVAVLAKSARAAGKAASYQPPSLPADCFFLSDYRSEYAGNRSGPQIDWNEGVGIWVNRRDRPNARLNIDAEFSFADGRVELANSHELGFAFAPAADERQLKAIKLTLRHDGAEYSSSFDVEPERNARVYELQLDNRVLIKPPFKEMRLTISGDRLLTVDGSGGVYLKRK